MFFWLTIFWIPRIDNVFLFDAILRIFYITLPFLYELEMWVDFKGGKALNAATTIFVTLPTFFFFKILLLSRARLEFEMWIWHSSYIGKSTEYILYYEFIQTFMCILEIEEKIALQPLFFRIIAAITKCCNVSFFQVWT